jgi:rubrerythrin
VLDGEEQDKYSIMDENRFNTIRLLIEIEQVTGEIYSIFSEKFIEYKDVWQELAKEERQHIDIIRTLSADLAVADDRVEYVNTVKVEELKTKLGLIKKQAELVNSTDFTLDHAIDIATQIEEHMIEFPYHELFKPKTPEMKGFIDGIVKAEERHKQTVERIANK